MTRVFNFSAGPAALPEPVLRRAAEEMLDWRGSGMSVMEMSHRGKEFMGIAAQAEADLRELMGIPANYKVLFLQGGASLQFAMVPLNLMGASATKRGAAYAFTATGTRFADVPLTHWAAKYIEQMKAKGVTVTPTPIAPPAPPAAAPRPRQRLPPQDLADVTQ